MNSLNRIQDEINRRVQDGQVRCTIHKLRLLYEELGYTFDRSLDCRSIARHITGRYAGASYPVLTLYPIQMDNKLSAFHVDARRDENFKKLQQLRNTHFAVSPTAIVEV